MMKKILTILMLLVSLMVVATTVDAKTSRKKTKARTSQTSRVFAKFTYNGDSWGLKKGGNVVLKLDGIYRESGKYVEDNTGYILVFGYGDCPKEVGVIYKNTLYYIGFTSEIGNVNTYHEIESYFASNLYDDHNCIKNVITFNPTTESIRFKSSRGWRELYLSNVPAKDRYVVTWAK